MTGETRLSAPETSYRKIIADRAEVMKLDKSQRTAMRLRAATADLLETCRYNDLRVTDIAQKAQVAHGTFYTYYKQRSDIIFAIIQEYFEVLGETMRPTVGADEYSRIRSATGIFVGYYTSNLGLMRCLRALSEQDGQFAALKQQIDSSWFERNIAHLSRTTLGASMERDDIRLMVYALGAMVEEFLYIRYQNPDPNVVRLTETEDDVAEKLARIWYRALYLRDPSD
ncbi:MAG TPA: TetR/AcrR family transcriptional regulator [Caulobacter sp.]|nr:TetR/AcrR family transcriptional regulator [Caulobacter sp.]